MYGREKQSLKECLLEVFVRNSMLYCLARSAQTANYLNIQQSQIYVL